MLEFNIPNITSEIEGNYGKFVIEPLERGYATTLGNSLRRVMLSSLPGAAVSYINIDGAIHEFSTIPGIKEDVTDIVLNVKGIVAKAETPCVCRIDFVGPGVVTAADIKCDPSLTIINPNQKIATVSEDVRFSMELGFSVGRGYVSAEANKLASDKMPLGTIFVDSIFTPVLKVSYLPENTRVGSQTDLDKLTVEVLTDGSITPADAMAVASDIMIKHFECISSLSEFSVKPEMVPDSESQKTAVLDTAVEDLEFSVRSFNCLKRANINTVGDITAMTVSEMMKIRNLGQKSFDEIKAKIEELGLSFKEE